MALAATYTIPELPLAPQVMVLSPMFVVLDVPCAVLWVGVGMGAAHVLRSARQLRAFNVAMAGLLVLSVAPLLAG